MKRTSKGSSTLYRLRRMDPIQSLDEVRKLINQARQSEGKTPFDFATRPELLKTGTAGTCARVK